MFLKKFELIQKYLFKTKIKISQLLLKSSLIPIEIYFKYIPKNGKILDLGCGEGLTANLLGLLRPDLEIIGIDKSSLAIDSAKKIKIKNVKFYKINFLKLNFINSKKFSEFDLIICNDVVHHINFNYHRSLVEKLIGKLKVNGHVVFKEVNKDDFLDYTLSKFFDKILYPKDCLSFRSKLEWLSFFERIGYEKKEIIFFYCKHWWPASKIIYCIKKKNITIQSEWEYKIYSTNLLNRQLGKKNVFITGGSGFIGKNFLLSQRNNKVFRFVALSRNVTFIKSRNIALFKSDLSELKENSIIFDNIDYVIHLASEVKYEGGKNLNENNINGTKYLLKSIGKRNKNKIKKIIFTSSIGAIERKNNDKCELPLNEMSSANPSSFYGYTKLVGEKLIKAFTKKNIILRICWCYGKYMKDDTHLKFISNSVKKNKIFTFFNYPSKINIIHVSDLCRIIEFFLTNKQINKNYFIHDGKPQILGSIIKELKYINNKPPFLLEIPHFLTKVVTIFRGIIPFKVKTLFLDTMVANNNFFKNNKTFYIKNLFPIKLNDLVN